MNIPYTHPDTGGEEVTGEVHTMPIGELTTIYRVLSANPTFKQKWLGFSVRAINLPEIALVKQVLGQRGGVVIDFVWKEGPAANAGIRSGDILVKMNGTPVLTPTHFKGTLFRTGNNTLFDLGLNQIAYSGLNKRIGC